jgi:wobble nucleotide-excising tRNase
LHGGIEVLKRIQTLRNIGRYKDCNAGSIEFGRLTILYGRNTYGKSTLGDVFASIQMNDSSLVTGRKTIPFNGQQQFIRLSLLPANSSKEVPIIFDNGAWTTTLPAGVGVRTFDDGFIHRNVFVAREFNRNTKENFSAFILGEQGVQHAKKIADKKQDRAQAIRIRNQLERAAFKDVGDLQSFLKLSPEGTLEESDAKLHNLRNEHDAVSKQKQQILVIQTRDEGAVLTWSADFSDGLKALNQTLGLGLEGTHKEAKAKVAQHIEATFHQSNGAEQWIRQGVQHNKGELCQFCGRELTDEAHKLLDLYRQAFDDAFIKHDTAIKQQITAALISAARLPVNDIRIALAKNSAALSGFPELQTNQTYNSAAIKVIEYAEMIEASLFTLSNELPDALNRLREISNRKQDVPHTPLASVDETSVILLETQIQKYVSEYNSWIGICNAEIGTFKKGTNSTQLTQRLEKIVKDGQSERYNNDRIRLASQCDEYQALITKIASLEQDIETLEKKLKTEQSDYLKNFFDSLDGWFKRFGSRDFTLERGENWQGHTPIYFLKIKYKGQPIDESALRLIFSESDRRALALALFWTQLQTLEESTLAKQVVVLDDPLTSFDDHRITAFHRELAATVDKVRQVIVLSHYRHDIEMFFETFSGNQDVQLLTLVADGANGTAIQIGNPREFILTEHQKAHERITAFGDGYTIEHSSGDLRIFFEIELNSRFAAQIANHKLATLQLGEKIDMLYEHGVIDEHIKQHCHTWRQVLNPFHHTWTKSDLENQRNTVREFLNFVYNQLIRKQ